MTADATQVQGQNDQSDGAAAYSVDLTKLRSNNTLDIQVRSGEEFLGTLKMGRGSVQWWPSNNKTHALRKNWRQFAEMLTSSMA